MVKVYKCCDNPNGKCPATNAEAPYAHEYYTFKDDKEYSHIDNDSISDYKPRQLSWEADKIFTSQDALNIAISDAEKLEKELGIKISVSECPS